MHGKRCPVKRKLDTWILYKKFTILQRSIDACFLKVCTQVSYYNTLKGLNKIDFKITEDHKMIVLVANINTAK